MRYAPSFALFAVMCTAACSDGSAPSSSSNPSTASSLAQARVARAIPRDGATWLTLDSVPGARCNFDVAEGAEPGKGLEVYADEEGKVSFRVRATDRRATVIPMRLDCVGPSGAQSSVDVDLMVDENAAKVGAPEIRPSRVRAPLLGDPMSFTREQLIARDFPPRPDPAKEPQKYAAWLELASRPVNVIEAKVVDTQRVHGPAMRPAAPANAGPEPFAIYTPSYFDNYSGYQVSGPDFTFDYIYGSWSVPSTTNEGGFWTTATSALWVGLGGYGGASIVQAGTEQDTSSRFWVESSAYYAWYEWYPGDNQQQISNFPVDPGDQITTWVWQSDANGYFMPDGPYAHFMVYDATTNNLAIVPPFQRPYNVSGGNEKQAEWILERPAINGSLVDLANYDSAVMTDAWAEDSTNTLHDYWTDGDAFSNEIYMNSTSDPSRILSEAIGFGRGTIYFFWDAYN